MSRPWRAASSLLLVTVLTACAGPEPDSGLDADRVLGHVVALTDIGPRPTGTAAAARALDYIEAALPSGLERTRLPTGRVALPGVRVGAMRIFEPGTIRVAEPNLAVRFPGRDRGARPLLLMAHADTVFGSPGAVDNAVSVGLLLELSRHLAAESPPRPVIIAFTAAEEHRLAGARALAQALGAQPGLAISLDMVGAPGPLTLNGVSRLLDRDLLAWLAAAARRADAALEAPPVHRVVSRHLPQIERSDHGAFTERGVPAVHLYNRGPGHVYLPYHGPADVPAQVDAGRASEAGRLLVAIALHPAPLPRGGAGAGVWISGPGGPRVISVWWLRLLGLALAAIAVAALVRLWLRRSRDRDGIIGLWASLVLFALGWLLAHALLAVAGAALEHPRPWAHAPGRHLAAAVIIAVAVAATGARLLVSRWRPAGAGRFLAAAITPLVLIGLALLVLDAGELALLPLACAAGFGAAAFARRRSAAVLFVIAGMVPASHLVHPLILREAVFHGFFPPTLPLVVWLALALAPAWLAVLYLLRRWPLPPVRPDLVATAAAVMVALAGAALLLPAPVCPGAEYVRDGLGCEVDPVSARGAGTR